MQHQDSLDNIEDLILRDGEASSLTSGASMRPMLRQHRDIVTIKKIDRPLKRGDAVLYPEKSGKYVLHRIIRVKEDIFIIRGDNNYFTERVPKEKIVGILKYYIREGKYIDCSTDWKYKCYVFYILHSYCLRYLWNKKLRPILSKIKRTIIKQKTVSD